MPVASNEDAVIRRLYNGRLVWRRSPPSKKPDCIWIAHAPAAADAPMTVSPPSRTEAAQIICAQLQSIVAAKHGRVLLCADFGYGYPGGFASLLANSVAGELPPGASSGNTWASTCVTISEPSQADNRPTATIALRWRAPSTPPCPIQNARVHSGVSSKRVFTLAFHRNGRSSRSSARAAVWVRFVSQTGERRAISVSPLRHGQRRRPSAYRDSAPRAMRFDPDFRAAPPCGRSRPGGRPRAEHGLIRRSEFCTRKSIRAYESASRTPLRIAARCARCGTGHATSTPGIH